MDPPRYKIQTQKRYNYSPYQRGGVAQAELLQHMLDEGAKDAYSRPWHRIERGLRLNRLRLFIEEISPEYEMSKEEKDDLFLFLQKSLDKKLLNTLKVVEYDLLTQHIQTIKGLDMKRDPETGKLAYSLNAKEDSKKPRATTTRKRKKDDIPSVSIPTTTATATVIDPSDIPSSDPASSDLKEKMDEKEDV